MRFRPCGHAACCELCTINTAKPSRQRLQCPICREVVAQLELLTAGGDGGCEPIRVKRMQTYQAKAESETQSFQSVLEFLQAMLESSDREVAVTAGVVLYSWAAEGGGVRGG